MSNQHDMDLLDNTGAGFRTDLNVALKALAANSRGDNAPSTTYHCQFWADTQTGYMKIRNTSNNDWIKLFKLSGIYTLLAGTHLAPSITFQDDLDTGIFSTIANTFQITTNSTERFRITSDGFTKLSPTATYHSATGTFHESVTATNGLEHIHVFSHNGSTAAEQLGIFIRVNNDSNNTLNMILCRAASTDIFVVRQNGTVQARTGGSFGTFSDSKLKENIVDASSQWDDIKAVKVRNFNAKDDPSKKLIGVVAQELETVSPGLVEDIADVDSNTNEDLGTVTKSVKHSILYMKAIKALQEAMTRIETLEAKVAALEGS